jgi:hypothetical protein
MRFRLELLILVAGFAGAGACQWDRPAAEPAEPVESAAVPLVPADSTASEPSPVARSEHRSR